VFERKDEKRLLSPEQRRVLWHREDRAKCSKGGRMVSWMDFTADHVSERRESILKASSGQIIVVRGFRQLDKPHNYSYIKCLTHFSLCVGISPAFKEKRHRVR
jgi:hypothetical protein